MNGKKRACMYQGRFFVENTEYLLEWGLLISIPGTSLSMGRR
jgi:hypothetical protein